MTNDSTPRAERLETAQAYLHSVTIDRFLEDGDVDEAAARNSIDDADRLTLTRELNAWVLTQGADLGLTPPDEERFP